MSCVGIRGTEEQGLSDKARSNLMSELFRRCEAEEPGSHKCFTGSDADLIAAVQRYRDEQDRERE